MLIRYVGRKTGKHYEIPVRYAERDGVIKCFTDKTAGWWPNLRENSEVSLVVRGTVMKVSTQVVVDDTEVLISELTKHLNEFPGDAVYKDVRLDHQRRPCCRRHCKTRRGSSVSDCYSLRLTCSNYSLVCHKLENT